MLRSTLRVFFCGARGDSWQLFKSYQMYRKSSINPFPFGLFISNTFQGGLIETGHVLEKEGLFNLVKMVVSALHKELECKVEKLNRGSCSSCSRGSKTNPTFQHVNKPSVQMKFYIRDWFLKQSIIYQWRTKRVGERGGGGLLKERGQS